MLAGYKEAYLYFQQISAQEYYHPFFEYEQIPMCPDHSSWMYGLFPLYLAL